MIFSIKTNSSCSSRDSIEYRDRLCLQGLYLEPRNSEMPAGECKGVCNMEKWYQHTDVGSPVTLASFPRPSFNHVVLSLESGAFVRISNELCPLVLCPLEYQGWTSQRFTFSPVYLCNITQHLFFSAQSRGASDSVVSGFWKIFVDIEHPWSKKNLKPIDFLVVMGLSVFPGLGFQLEQVSEDKLCPFLYLVAEDSLEWGCGSWESNQLPRSSMGSFATPFLL